ncbi:type IV secretory system conjugative DNA transfer family protein [Curtobacterium sp. VKM Ac-1395]|uniref:type IV secretory system conjugative DNA transfer family protein n=1 Tax=Curtobacterium sp. VKM Ac-1395 TaxID=2783815 RepID=UPI00188DB7C2|nr:TraM recognition domain-containing protein [Curtobacterium sp. VKM Ac-1395]MBF4592074.1 type IV secretory system conjugative DNA transfer family protein [Curtobacterium sp. VKM Ac-1395]
MSNQQTNRRTEPGRSDPNVKLYTTMFGILAGAVVSAWVGLVMASKLSDTNPNLPRDPFKIATGIKKGTIEWTSLATVLSIIVVVILIALVVVSIRVLRPSTKNRTRADSAAKYLASTKDLVELQEKRSLEKAARLGLPDCPGVPLGKDMRTGRMLYASWEDVTIGIAGPRVGKTTSLVVPAILAAPGALLTTSNKPDTVETTRSMRDKVGTTWVFDPQQLVNEEPSWWWNPLSYVTDDTTAARLAGHFAAGSREVGDKGDAFFDPAGKDLLAGMLLAAALDNRPITDVFAWLTNPDNREMVAILRNNDYPLIANDVESASRTSPKQRDGVYGTARKMAACLKNSSIGKWVTPLGGSVAGDRRKQFSPDEFVRGTDTLYSLSKEGEGTAAPLVTALTVAVVEAGERFAKTQPGGRMATPLLCILDEAANVCRWKDLPDLYSHYGSRGIPIMSIFQSWSQGVDVFTLAGMRKLFSAANEVVYLGGVKETEWLRELSELLGDYDHETVSYSMNRGVRSTNVQNSRRRILDTSELAELPRGRAILLASGLRSSMIKTAPWFESADAEKITESIASYKSGERVQRTASTTATVATAVAPADNPWLNGSTVQPIETETER